MHALAEKLFRKFQQVSATATESTSRKGSFQQLVNVLWKRTLPHLFFYIATLISLTSPWKYLFFSTCVFFHNHSRITELEGKGEGISLTPHYHFHPLHRHWDISRAITAETSPLHTGSNRSGNSFSIHGSWEIFPLINDLMICKCISCKCVKKGAVLQYSYIMWKSGERQICSRSCWICLENALIIVSTKLIKNIIFMINFQFLIFLIDIFKSGKEKLRSWCKMFYSIFSNKHAWHSLKSRYSIIHCNPNDSNIVQIIYHTPNHLKQYKSFNAVKIIQRSTNLSTYYKSFNIVESFNVVQIFQRSTNHST